MNLDGFTGFIPVKEMATSCDKITKLPGVYVVLRETNTPPEFVAEGTGGFFKGRNPNVDVSVLESEYVEGTNILYIGKANDLNKRIKQLIKFGNGNAIGHWGGRYLWQLVDAEDLIIALKPTPDVDSRSVEIKIR